jgi:hypothetical protein
MENQGYDKIHEDQFIKLEKKERELSKKLDWKPIIA